MPASVDTKACLHVSASALFIQLAKLVLVLEQRSLSCLLPAAVHQFLHRGVEEYNRQPRAVNQPDVRRLSKGSAAERNYGGLQAQFTDQYLQGGCLFRAERRLAFSAKYLRHVATVGGDDAVIQIDEPPAQVVR